MILLLFPASERFFLYGKLLFHLGNFLGPLFEGPFQKKRVFSVRIVLKSRHLGSLGSRILCFGDIGKDQDAYCYGEKGNLSKNHTVYLRVSRFFRGRNGPSREPSSFRLTDYPSTK